MPAHRCVGENGLAAMLATKRLAGVTPEVNIRECVICIPTQSANKATPSGFDTRGRCHQKFITGVSVAPQKQRMNSKFFLKKYHNKTF